MASQKVIDFIRKKLIQLNDKETNLSGIKESDLQLGRICEEVNFIRYTISP